MIKFLGYNLNISDEKKFEKQIEYIYHKKKEELEFLRKKAICEIQIEIKKNIEVKKNKLFSNIIEFGATSENEKKFKEYFESGYISEKEIDGLINYKNKIDDFRGCL